jgi:hypothetical protein
VWLQRSEREGVRGGVFLCFIRKKKSDSRPSRNTNALQQWKANFVAA